MEAKMRYRVLPFLAFLLACNAMPGADAVRRTFKKEALYEGKPVSYWIEQLQDKSPKTRKQAAVALGKIGPEAEAGAPALLEVLRDLGSDRHPKDQQGVLADKEEAEVFGEVVTAMALIGEKAVPTLRSALADRAPAVRGGGAVALFRMGPAAAPAVPDLIACLRKEETWQNRFNATLALASIGPLAEAAVPTLVETLKRTPELRVRRAAATALGRIGRKPELAVPALVLALKERDYGMRETVAAALGTFGPAAREAVPALQELLTLNDFGIQYQELRRAAAQALQKIQGSS
jgi:HEAT repeat protein